MVKQVDGDITKLNADVIINAANTGNIHGGGVDLAIARAAGEIYTKASNAANGAALGKFLVSPAGNLKAKVIIDIPTIDLTSNEIITLAQFKQVWADVLDYCLAKSYKSVATPVLGAGVVGYDKDEVIKLLSDVAKQYIDIDTTIVNYV